MLQIDGSLGEGGGAILRVATGLSVVTGKAIRVSNIRAKRPEPGLKTQHLVGLNAVAELSGSELTGAALRSTEITFTPSKDWKKKIKVNIQTAGSVGLVLQPLEIACLAAPHPVEIEISGGATWGKWAPPVDFLCHVTHRLLEKMGCTIAVSVERAGFYPVGGAKVTVRITPPTEKLQPLVLESFGKIESVRGSSVAAAALEKAQVAERQKKSARQVLFKELEITPQIEAQHSDSVCPGSGITLWAQTDTGAILGADAFGEKGKRAEVVGEEAAQKLLTEIAEENTIDRHAADQLLPFMALAAGESRVRVKELTSHTKTNIALIEQFLPERRILHENGVLSVA